MGFLILGTMLSKASYFISMPYLALRLKFALGMSPPMIGLTLGLGPCVGILAGFYIGYLSDHWGRKRLFSGSILIWSLTFAGFAVARHFWQFAALNMLNGLCTSATQPVSAALISDLTETALRKTAFHLRYFAINLGASFGPVLGAWLLLRDPAVGFFVTSVVYLLYGLACVACLPSDSKQGTGAPSGNFSETLAALAQDRPLLLYTLAFVLMGATYSQLDSTLPQYLQGARGEEGIRLFGLLMGANAASVVVFQLPLTRLMSRFSLLGTVKAGTFVYGLGMALLGLIGHGQGHGKAGFLFAMVVLTLGEILIFSNGNLVIDQIAPEDKKGAYFGASSLWALGATLGPGIGGWVLLLAGGRALFAIAGLVAIGNVLIYRAGERAERGGEPGRPALVPA